MNRWEIISVRIVSTVVVIRIRSHNYRRAVVHGIWIIDPNANIGDTASQKDKTKQ